MTGRKIVRMLARKESSSQASSERKERKKIARKRGICISVRIELKERVTLEKVERKW